MSSKHNCKNCNKAHDECDKCEQESEHKEEACQWMNPNIMIELQIVNEIMLYGSIKAEKIA